MRGAPLVANPQPARKMVFGVEAPTRKQLLGPSLCVPLPPALSHPPSTEALCVLVVGAAAPASLPWGGTAGGCEPWSPYSRSHAWGAAAHGPPPPPPLLRAALWFLQASSESPLIAERLLFALSHLLVRVVMARVVGGGGGPLFTVVGWQSQASMPCPSSIRAMRADAAVLQCLLLGTHSFGVHFTGRGKQLGFLGWLWPGTNCQSLAPHPPPPPLVVLRQPRLPHVGCLRLPYLWHDVLYAIRIHVVVLHVCVGFWRWRSLLGRWATPTTVPGEHCGRAHTLWQRVHRHFPLRCPWQDGP